MSMGSTRRYSFEQFAAVRNYADLTFSPDGRRVAYTASTSGQFNVWVQPVAAGPDGEPLMARQLTDLTEETARRVAWSPDGARIVTQADRHGNENFQLYEVPADRGWLYPLTDEPESRFELADEPFSPDGRAIAYGTNARTPTDFDAVTRDLATGETRPVLAGDATYFPGAWSPDGLLLVGKFTSNTDQDLYVVDPETGEQRHVTPHEGEVKFYSGPWSPDARGFYLLSDRDREYIGLAYYDLQAGELRWVATPEWDVNDVALAKDGRRLAWLVNEGGYSRLYVRDLASGETRDYSNLPRGVYSSLRFSPDGGTIGLYIARPVRPASLYLLDVETGRARELTQSFLGGIPVEEMVAPDLSS